MKLLFLRACTAGQLMLCLLSKPANAQNLHQTVTHGDSGAAITEDSSRNAAQNKTFAHEAIMTYDAQTQQAQDDGVPHTVEQWKEFIKSSYTEKYYDFGTA